MLRHRAGISLLIAWTLAAPVQAFDFVVTRLDDPAPGSCLPTDCSLREAVIASNFASDSDRILLSAGTYRLTIVGAGENDSATGDLDARKDVEIIGAGASITFIDAAGLGDQVIHAVAAGGLDFSLRRVTVRNGSQGGLVLGVGTHILEEVEIRDNGTGTTGNGATTGIASQVTIRHSTIAGNAGRGLSVTQGSATVENSTISGNGGIDVFANLAVEFSCTHCTIADATDTDAAVELFDTTVEFANSIVAGSCSLGSGAAIDSLGGNVESIGDSCHFDHASDVILVTAPGLALAGLADNGGPTRTHLPGAASAANGSANDALCASDDQRAVVRETNCESGSVERTNQVVLSSIFADGFLQGSTGAWSLTVP